MNLEGEGQAPAVDEANLESTEAVKPEGHEQVETQTPPTQPVQPSTISQEQHDAAISGMNKAQEEAATLRAQRELLQSQLSQHQNALAQFGTQHVQNQDPIAAAEAQLATARESFDPVQISDATLRLAGAQRQSEMAQMRQQLLYEQKVNNEMPNAAKILGVNDMAAAQVQLANVGKTLTPTELAIVQRWRDNTIGELIDAKNKQQSDEQERAKFFTSLSEPGGARRVPGSHDQQVDGQISYWQWLAGSEEFREGQRNSDKNIQVTGAPPGFDPMKE